MPRPGVLEPVSHDGHLVCLTNRCISYAIASNAAPGGSIPSSGPFTRKVSKSFPPNSFEAFDTLTRNMDVQRSKALISAVAPPERIGIDYIVVRCWEPVDLTAGFEAVTKSYTAIHPWMEWRRCATNELSTCARR